MKICFFALSAFALLSFASCKKEDSKACYKCTITAGTGGPSATQEYCDKTQSEIDAIQNASSAGAVKTTCVKK